MSSPFLWSSLWKKNFFCFFSMARENRDICAFLKWTCLGSISIWIQNLKINTMSQNRYYVPKLIECLKINRMSQNWLAYNDPKLIQWHKNMPCHGINTIWIWKNRLIQWLEIDTMTQNRHNDSKLIRCHGINTMFWIWYNILFLCRSHLKSWILLKKNTSARAHVLQNKLIAESTKWVPSS